MLILSRRIGEVVVINDDIFCTILGLQGRQVRLGFAAPDSVIVHRAEIYARIQQEKSAALLALNQPLSYRQAIAL